MNKYFLFIATIFTVCIGCKETVQTVDMQPKKETKNNIVKHKTFTALDSIALKKIESWKEYHLLNDFLKRYESTSSNEAFDNVSELKDLTRALKDSLTITDFKTPSFRTRLNVLNNEVLRLFDMANIPAITNEEVNIQIDKIFVVYGSLNDKINTVYYQKKFEEEIDLDDFFNLKENPEKEVKGKEVKEKKEMKDERTNKKHQNRKE